MRRIRQRPGLMLGLVPVVLLTAACTSTQPEPTTPPQPTSAVTATLTPRAQKFVSTVYNFGLTLPKGWTGVDAAPYDTWDGQILSGHSTAFANFSDLVSDRSFVLGAAPVVMGTTVAAWQRAMVRANPAECPDVPGTNQPTTIGGEPALTWRSNCAGGVQTVRFAVVHGARGYVAIFVPSGAHLNAADRAVFDPILRSFHFTS